MNGDPVDIVYGNIGFNSNDIIILSGSKGTGGDYNFKPIYGAQGLYFVQFEQAFSYPPAVVLTQVYHGPGQLSSTQDPQWETSPQWGSTLDNSVLVGISEKEFKLITGDSKGNKRNSMFGFIAVGYPDTNAELGYVDPHSRAAALKHKIS